MGSITSPRDALRILIRRSWIIALILVIGLPAALVFALSQPRVYEATAVVQIESAQVVERLTTQSGAPARTINPTNELDLIEQQLMSRDSILEIVRRFDLFAAAPTQAERVGLMREAVEITQLIDEAQAWRADVHPSGLIITVRLGEADAAADVANAFLERVLEAGRERTSGRTERTLEFLVSEEERLTAEIEALEAAYSQFRQENSDALPDAIDSQRTQRSRLEESRITIEEQLIELESGGDRMLAETLERQRALLGQRLDLTDEAIAEIEATLAAAPEVERQLNVYDRRLGQLQGELSVITDRRAQAAMNQLLESRNQAERFEVLESAIPADYPVSASRRKMAMAGGVLVVFLALGAALALEILDGRLRTPEDLERELGVQPVVAIPNLRSQGEQRRGRLLWIGGITLAVIAGVAALRGWLRSLLPADRPSVARGQAMPAVVQRRVSR